MSAYLEGLVSERAQLGEAAKNTYDTAAEAKRELSTEERTNVEKWEQRCRVLDKEIERLADVAEASQKFGKLAERAGVVVEQRRERARPAAEQTQYRTAGERFTASDAFKHYGGRGSSAAFDLGADFLRQRAAITTAATNGDPAMWWSGPPEKTYVTPLLDAIGRVATSQGTVEYMTHSDASLAELVPEGELKPEATITFEMKSLPLDTYAHWEAITRQALADIPRIQSIVDGALRRGVLLKLEQEVGTVLGSAALPMVTPPAGSTTLGRIRLGVAAVEADGFQPHTLLMNPQDLADVDLDAMAATLNGPTSTTSYWGLTPVTSAQVPKGTAYVGDFKSGMTWFDRTGTEVFLSDSHADFFIRNQLVILAEARAAFAVTEPQALVKIPLATASDGA